MGCAVGGLSGWLWEAFAFQPPSLSIALFILAYVAGGWHTLIHAVDELRHGRVNVDLLMIAAAIGSAILGHWADGAALLFLFSLSHTLETYILGRTRRAIADLMDLTPEEAIRLRDGVEERVPIASLAVKDIVLVHPGERFPADGIVREGQTSVDQSPMTGESIPVDKQPGDLVFAGTLNQQGVIQVEVTHAAGQTTLARMVKLVEQAQSERASTQRFTEWFGERYTWFVLALSAATILLPWWLGWNIATAAFQRAMTVLVVASPCAVVISIPAAILAAITSAARGGVLFKGGAALEQTASLKAMAFDKTGTLTLGRPRVVEVLTAADHTADEVLSIAAGLERHSEHPLARAVVQAAEERGIASAVAEDVTAVTAMGITGAIDGRQYRIGKVSWLCDLIPNGEKAFAPLRNDGCIALTPSQLESRRSQGDDNPLVTAVRQAQQRGETVVVLADEARWLGAFAIADTLRPTAVTALQELRAIGVKDLVMLTGDSEAVAHNMAERLGLKYQAALLPAQKLETIRRLRETVGPTGMIGDGMNDAPSLAAATVGFSLGGAGTDVALETADVVILADDLRRLPYAIGLSRRAQQIIRQNLIVAFGMMGLLLVTTYITTLPLPLAVLGHEGSTVVVILNGLRLLWFPKPPHFTESSKNES